MKLPQLSLRELFWMVLVVAMGFAWWVDKRQSLARQQEQFLEERRLLVQVIKEQGLRLMWYGNTWEEPQVVAKKSILRQLLQEEPN